MVTPDHPTVPAPRRGVEMQFQPWRRAASAMMAAGGKTRVIAFVWQFKVQPGREAAFEQFFGANGPWQGLSRRSRSFLGSSFLRDAVQPTRYLVAEYWSEMLVYE